MKLVPSWSVFGHGPLKVGFRVAPERFSLDSTVDAFRRHDAVILGLQEGSFDCELLARKYLGIGYSRNLRLPCVVEIRAGENSNEWNLMAVCDLEPIRKAKRLLFYALSVFALVLVVANAWRQYDILVMIVLLLPWPVAEVQFLVDRERLRRKVSRILKSLAGTRVAFGEVAEL